MMNSFVEEDMSDMKRFVEENGMDNLSSYIEEKMNVWWQVPVNMAVTGDSGVGTSTLINTMRGLKANDLGAAAVGVTETTLSAKSYPHPDNDNLKVWDLPGMGTSNFYKDSYLQDINYERYDYSLILSATRFSENDLYLAKELDAKQKRFIFVRSKIDADLQNEKEDHPELSEEEVKKRVRDNIFDNLKKKGINENSIIIYLVNCKSSTRLEFQIFLEYVMKHLPSAKKEAMEFTLRATTKEMVKQKRDVLQSQIYKVALKAAIDSSILIPEFGLVGDTTILLKQTIYYIHQLGLDDSSIRHLAREYGIADSYLLAIVPNWYSSVSITAIVQMCTALGADVLFAISPDKRGDLASLIPFIEAIVTAPVSYNTTCFILQKILDRIAEDAVIVFDAVVMYKAQEAANI